MRTIKANRGLIFTLVLALGITQGLFSQQVYEISTVEQSFKVLGTSTLHDWHMESSSAEGQFNLVLTDGLPSFTASKISFIAETLKSGKRGMDKNAYKALKTDEYPNIEFTLSECSMESATKGLATGRLIIAGFTRDVTFKIEVEKSSSAFIIKGSTDFLLTDFQIDPPKALMGTIKTGNAVTIEFNSTFKTR